MSKFLKFLVNTFLIAAILVAAAILIPPIAGVTTTIVDTTSMDTNLPLGSITYSTSVDVSNLKVGDEVLKDNDISTYAYIIRSGDETTGRYQVVSATDPDGREEEIYLRNAVSKVAVVIPYIGYIMIAMHSIEGIIIIALVVILMIILFILSELWKPRDEEYDDEDQEEVVSSGLSDANENGIDTDTIRAAMEANVAAVSSEDAAEGEEEVDESNLSRAERRALKKARKQAEKEAKAAARRVDLDGAAEGGDAVDFRMPTDDEEAEAAAAALASAVAATSGGTASDASDDGIPQIILGDGMNASGEEEQVVVPSELEEFAGASRLEAFAAEAEAEMRAAAGEEAEPAFYEKDTDSAFEGEQAPDGAASGEAADGAASGVATASEAASDEAVQGNVLPEEASPEKEIPDAYAFREDNAEIGIDDLPVIDESVLNFADEIEEPDASADVPELERESDIGFAADSPVPDLFGDADVFDDDEPEAVRFTPTKRPTLSEMLDQAKGAGENPAIVEDKDVGVTVLDYSDLI